MADSRTTKNLTAADRWTFMGHLLVIFSTVAFSVSALLRLSEDGRLPDGNGAGVNGGQSMQNSGRQGFGNLTARDYFS